MFREEPELTIALSLHLAETVSALEPMGVIWIDYQPHWITLTGIIRYFQTPESKARGLNSNVESVILAVKRESYRLFFYYLHEK